MESQSNFTFTFAFTFARSAWYWYKSIQSYKATSLSLSLGLNTPLRVISPPQMCKCKHLPHSSTPPWVVQYMINDVLRNPHTFHLCTHLICIGQWGHIRIDKWSHLLVVDPRETESREIHFNSSDHLFHSTCISVWSPLNTATHKEATAVASSYCNTNFHIIWMTIHKQGYNQSPA